MTLSLLLLQARHPDDPMGQHEIDCFARTCELGPEQIVPFDLLAGPPSLADIRRHDALLVGGSGDFYVSRGNLPGHDGLQEVLGEVAQVGHPTFASCFGYQYFVEALGGEVIHDPPNTEVGTFELELTDAGRDDPLFGHLPLQFNAQMGHKDRAASHPDGLPNLARSPRAPFQALRVPNQPVWATQFHPELDRTTNLERFTRYLEGYATVMSDEARAEAMDGFRESPEASSLLRRFLRLVFG